MNNFYWLSDLPNLNKVVPVYMNDVPVQNFNCYSQIFDLITYMSYISYICHIYDMKVWQILAATLTAASHDWKACELSLRSVLGCRKQCGVNRNRKKSIFCDNFATRLLRKLPKRSNLNHFVLSSVAIKSCWQHDKLLSSLHMDGGWAALKIAKQNTCHEQQKPVPILFYLPCLKTVPALDDIQEVRTT